MTWSAGILYVSTLVVVSGYVTAGRRILRRIHGAQDISWRSWAFGQTFYTTCGMTHSALGWHAWTLVPMIHADGTVHWFMWMHMPVQAAAIWLYLKAQEDQGPRPSALPRPSIGRLLRPRVWCWRLASGPVLRMRQRWWELGQPRSRFFRAPADLPLEGGTGG
jgi:hypothetical protein